MRPLTQKEKELSKAARNRASAALKERAKKILAEVRSSSTTYSQRLILERELDSILLNPIKGHPVRLRVGGREIVLNYDLVHAYCKTLRGRHVQMRVVTLVDGRQQLIIRHQDSWNPNLRGAIELYELLDHQRKVLVDLPLIDLTKELIT